MTRIYFIEKGKKNIVVDVVINHVKVKVILFLFTDREHKNTTIFIITMAEEHTHHHHHHDHHDYVKNNAEHFSENAQTYRTELSIELAKRCAGVLLKNYSFDPNKTEVLDFACGPGLIAWELLPHTKRIVGADAAQGMIDVFNQTVNIDN